MRRPPVDRRDWPVGIGCRGPGGAPRWSSRRRTRCRSGIDHSATTTGGSIEVFADAFYRAYALGPVPLAQLVKVAGIFLQIVSKR